MRAVLPLEVGILYTRGDGAIGLCVEPPSRVCWAALRALFPLLPGLAMSACLPGGDIVELDVEPGLHWEVVVEGNQVSVAPLGPVSSSGVVDIPAGAQGFILHLASSRLETEVPHFHREELELTEAGITSERETDCPAGILRRRPEQSIFLELPARDLGTLHMLGDRTSTGRPLPPKDWPEALRGLVVRVPQLEPCQDFPGRIESFAAGPRLFELRDRFGPYVVSPEFVGGTHVRAVEYVDDDHVLVTYPVAVSLLTRGERAASALSVFVRDVPNPLEETGSEFLHADLDDDDAPRRRGHAILGLFGPGDRSLFRGFSIVEFSVTSTSISEFRLRDFFSASDPDLSVESLRRITHRADGGFIAVGRNLIVQAEGSGPVRVTKVPLLDAAAVLLMPAPLPSLLIQDRSVGWWVGDTEDVEGLTLESSGLRFHDEGGSTRIIKHADGDRPVSSVHTGDLWTRVAPGHWRQHRWWLPETARACAAIELVCGRPVLVPESRIRDLGDWGGGILHPAEGCNGVFYTPASTEDQCSAFLPRPWAEHRLLGGGTSLSFVATRGERALLGGDGGLLQEVILE